MTPGSAAHWLTQEDFLDYISPPQLSFSLTNITPLFLIQRRVIAVFVIITGIGFEIMKFSLSASIAQGGIALWVMSESR